MFYRMDVKEVPSEPGIRMHSIKVDRTHPLMMTLGVDSRTVGALDCLWWRLMRL